MQIHTNAPEEMKQTGRPPLPKARRKSDRLNVRFTSFDLQKLESLSKKMKSSKADVIRTLIAQA
jgi:hypothetical protein